MQLHVDAARGKDRVVVRALLLIGSARVSQRFEGGLGRGGVGRPHEHVEVAAGAQRRRQIELVR